MDLESIINDDVLDFLKQLMSFKSVNPHFLGQDDPVKHKMVEDFIMEPSNGFYQKLFGDFTSYLREEEKIQKYIANKLQDIGFKVYSFRSDEEVINDARNTYEWLPARSNKHRPLVLGVLTPEKLNPNKGALIFNGHVDTFWFQGELTPENIDKMFVVNEDDENIYGRGSCDMKAGVAAFIKAAEYANNSGELDRTIIIQSVVDEEAGGCGGGTCKLIHEMQNHKELSELLLNIEGAVCAEPTELQVCNSTKGFYIGKVNVKGAVSGYTGASGKSFKDPVKALYEIREAMIKLKEEGHYEIGPGTFAAGTWIAGWPSYAELGFGLGYDQIEMVNQLDHQKKLYSEFEEMIQSKGGSVNIIRHLPSSYVPEENEFVQKTIEIANEYNGEKPAIVFPAWCDTYHLNTAGIPTVTVGPGNLEHAHTRDEKVSKQQTIDACKLYSKMMLS